jgi:hypothetical protein
MSLEDKFREHDGIPIDKYEAPNVSYEMSTRDYVLRPSADGHSGPIVITLPAVSEAKGRWYSIICRNADAKNTITVQDKDDSECWPGDFVLNGKCDRALLYSDGLAWLVATSLAFLGTTPSPTSVAPATNPV